MFENVNKNTKKFQVVGTLTRFLIYTCKVKYPVTCRECNNLTVIHYFYGDLSYKQIISYTSLDATPKSIPIHNI